METKSPSWIFLVGGKVSARGYRGFVVIFPAISEGFRPPSCKCMGGGGSPAFLAEQRGMLLFQLRSYILGYSRLTLFQRDQFRRLWAVWSTAEREWQLRLLDEGGLDAYFNCPIFLRFSAYLPFRGYHFGIAQNLVFRSRE